MIEPWLCWRTWHLQVPNSRTVRAVLTLSLRKCTTSLPGVITLTKVSGSRDSKQPFAFHHFDLHGSARELVHAAGAIVLFMPYSLMSLSVRPARGSGDAKSFEGNRVCNLMANPRIKLTACGTFTHGKKRRRSHAAAYPHR